jgi:V/A-type H+/Na+-transporting ATPase subunit B
MRKVYDRIIDMRGNLITVAAQGVSLGEVARVQKKNGTSTFASVLRITGELVTLQVFENTRGISTGDQVTFLGRQIQATFSDALLGRRLNGA